MAQTSVQLDPLNSPHPIPWNWVLATQSEASATGHRQLRYYRTPSLISPDGKYAAYSRIQMEVQPVMLYSRISSVLFVENLQTGELQTLTPCSPLADHPFAENPGRELAGTIAIAIPVSWSAMGDRFLAREFESMFCSGLASDYAIVWQRRMNFTSTITPRNIQYTNAVLLGWSQIHPFRVLFRAGNIGHQQWPLWAVDLTGDTVCASGDRPTIFGRTVSSVWAGPQAHR